MPAIVWLKQLFIQIKNQTYRKDGKMLDLLGCIQITRVSKLTTPGLFSRRIRNTVISDDLLLTVCERTIEVNMDGPMKLSYFLDTASQLTSKVGQEVTTTPDQEVTMTSTQEAPTTSAPETPS